MGRDAFKICWIDPNDSTKGFEYLYLTSSDYERLRGSVRAHKIQVSTDRSSASLPGRYQNSRQHENQEERWVITDIIGASPDLGVENLRGSGTIAGETSRAYDEIFTLTYVTGRCVGIGAYLVRLGQRTIQKESSSPILLTGYQALNKLMGRTVYNSNLQLGGPDIMYKNGVSHLTVQDEFTGVVEIVRWLSYIPSQRGGPLPVLSPIDSNDTPDRTIDAEATKIAQDPRVLLAGYLRHSEESKGSVSPDSEWASGFFDRGSWTECMGGWANTVVTGRARLAGIPVGVIATEMRSVQHTTPADPASPDSRERVTMQAGQVWFPDSAHKTATAIRDFRREELPLMIFANWRGFSGGQRDMFDEVLKFGSLIVDALVEYEQPVFVYLPPHSTLRGGAWVVVDPTINPDVMEMYADSRARGGVLETSGSVSIKYRKQQLIETAHRVDKRLNELDAQLQDAADAETATDIRKEISRREKRLLGVMLQIAEHFADLHDTPGRMQAKGVIHGIVDWKTSRSFFYWRLRRRLAEFALRRAVAGQATGHTTAQCAALIKKWFLESAAKAGQRISAPQPAWKQYAFGGSSGDNFSGEDSVPATMQRQSSADNEKLWKNDRQVLAWLNESSAVIDAKITELRSSAISSKIQALGIQEPSAAIDGLLSMLRGLGVAERQSLLQSFQEGMQR